MVPNRNVQGHSSNLVGSGNRENQKRENREMLSTVYNAPEPQFPSSQFMRQVCYQENARPRREAISEFQQYHQNNQDRIRYNFPNREEPDRDDPRESYTEPQFRGRRPMIQDGYEYPDERFAEPVYNRSQSNSSATFSTSQPMGYKV